jgi:hypothetical protein
MKGLTAARIGPKHTAHFVTHRRSRSSRLDFDELVLEGTLPTNTSVKRTTARLPAKSAYICLPIQIHHGDLVHSTTGQIKPPIGSCDHIADHAAAGWDRLRTEALRLRNKLYRVLGFTPDSLYQTSPSLVTAIPYGSDPVPPGDAHSFSSFPLAGSKCPRYPRA